MSRPIVFLTRRWPEAVERVLRERYDAHLNLADEPLTANALRAAVAAADALCPTVTDRIDAHVLDAAGPRFKIIANYGVGFEHVDLAAARQRGIIVCNTPDVLTEATADLTLTLLLAVARRAVEGDAWVRRGAWPGWRPTQMLGTQVTGKTLGLVGYGRIAQAVAERAHRGFGMRIRAVSPRGIEGRGTVPVERCATLEELLRESDVVSLHCPPGRTRITSLTPNGCIRCARMRS